MSFLGRLAQRMTKPDLLRQPGSAADRADGSGAWREPPQPYVDGLCGDPSAHLWAARLAHGEWAGFSEFLRSQTDVEDRDFYVRALAGTIQGWPQWLDHWQQEQPGDPMARLFRGERYVSYAWEARGSGYADSVQSESWSQFFQRLEAADEELAVAADLVPDDPGPWVVMLTTARGRQLGIGELRRRFAEVERRHPLHAMACSQVLQGVAAKWGGSDEMMFEFARSTVARAPQGLPVHLLLAEARYEEWMRLDDRKGYWSRKDVCDDIVRAAVNALTNHVEGPRTVIMRNSLAFFLALVEEPVLAREQFERVGNIVCGQFLSLRQPLDVWLRTRSAAYREAAASA